MCMGVDGGISFTNKRDRCQGNDIFYVGKVVRVSCLMSRGLDLSRDPITCQGT